VFGLLFYAVPAVNLQNNNPVFQNSNKLKQGEHGYIGAGMRQFLVAVMLLASAVISAVAQETNDKASPGAVTPAPSPSDERCGDASPLFTCPPSGTQVKPSAEPLFTDRPASRNDSAPEPQVKAADNARETDLHFRWGLAVKQSLLFLSVQHGYALTQPKTRRDLRGNFFKDYGRSVRSLHGWEDGGRFFTNYVAHPMQGSLMGFVQVQNDPAGAPLRFGRAGNYWRSRAKALAWSAACSTQFEIGPVSQASIGNVGLHGKQTYVDLVMTPTAGIGMLIAEDALDRYVIERLERRSHNKYVRIFSRMTLNPTRTAANLLRFKKPWHRDAGLR
jgi:hypothetical protein